MWDRQRAASLLKVETGNCAFVLFAYKERRDFRIVLDLTEESICRDGQQRGVMEQSLPPTVGIMCSFISLTKIYVSWCGSLWIDVI